MLKVFKSVWAKFSGGCLKPEKKKKSNLEFSATTWVRRSQNQPVLLLGERGSAVGGPAPISTPCSAEVCALSLPRWHPGHTQGAGTSLPSARPEAARTMTPAPPLLQPCQATTLHQSQGPAHPPQHPWHRDRKVLLSLLFPSPVPPGWPLPKPAPPCWDQLRCGRAPQGTFSPVPTGFIPCTQSCPKTFYLHLPEQPLISSPLWSLTCVTHSGRAAGRGSSSVSRSCHPSGVPCTSPSLLHNQKYLFPAGF